MHSLTERPAKSLERATGEGESPVSEKECTPEMHLSNVGHEKSGVNLGGPPLKAKYYHLTDSEQVPRGKGEKNPDGE